MFRVNNSHSEKKPKFCRSRIKKASGRPKSEEYEILHEVADSIEPVIRADLVNGVHSFGRKIDLRAVSEALALGDTEGAISLIPWDEFPEEAFSNVEELYRTGAVNAAEASTPFFKNLIERLIPVISDPRFLFDSTNPRFAEKIKEHTGALIENVTVSARESVQSLVSRSMDVGLTPNEIARRIPRSMGLTERQQVALSNFEEALREGRTGGFTEFQRRTIAPNGGNIQAALRTKTTEKLVNDYQRRLLNYRMERIARTESIRAVNLGQMEVWNQAADEGLFHRGTAKRVWVVTPDDRLCPICSEMEGQEVPFESDFEPPSAEKIGSAANGLMPEQFPPIHPNCRCAMRLIFT